MRSEEFSIDATVWPLSSGDALTFRDLYTGVFCTGETGAGKTSGMFDLAQRLLDKKIGGLVSTVKPNDLAEWHAICSDLKRIAPDGLHFNFLTAAMQQGGVMALSAVMLEAMTLLSRKQGTGAGDDFWQRAALQLLRSIATILHFNERVIRIDDLYLFSVSLDSEDKTGVAWDQIRKCETSTSHDVQASVVYLAKEFYSLDRRTSSSIQITLSALCDLLRRDPIRQVLCNDTTCNPEDTRAGTVFVMDMPVKTFLEGGQLAQSILLLSFFRGWEAQPGRPAFVWVDEAQYFVSQGFTLFQSTARSASIVSVYLTQNLPLFEAELGGDQLATKRVAGFIGNLATKVFFLQSEEQTNKWASAHMDEKLEKMRSSNHSVTYDPADWKYTYSDSTGESEQYQPRVRTSEFKKLRSGGAPSGYIVEAYLFKAGRRFFNGKNYLKIRINQKRRGADSSGNLFQWLWNWLRT